MRRRTGEVVICASLLSEDNVYVSFRCWESEPGQIIANEMRRNGPNVWPGNDTFMLPGMKQLLA